MNSQRPFLVQTGKGFSLKYKNRFLYSPSRPRESVLEKIKRLHFEPATLVFIPSPALGYGLAELAALVPRDVHLLCLERDRVLWEFMRGRSEFPLPVDERLTVLQTDSAAVACAELRKLGLHRFRRVKLISLNGGYGLDAAGYNHIFKALEAEIRGYWQNKITLIHMAPLWLKNLFSNLVEPGVRRNVADLQLTGPLLVAGAGASLEESIPLIREIRHRITLLAVDTAFPVLLNHDIRPDYILVVEAQLANLWDFCGCPHPGVPVICDLTSSNLVLRRLQGEYYFFCSHFYPVQLLGRLQAAGLLPLLIPPLGSVGIVALYLALHLGTGPVLLSGLDFSYTRDKSHSRGAPVNTMMLEKSDRLFPVGQLVYQAMRARPLRRERGKRGEDLWSDMVLSSYARQARELCAPSRRVFDLATCGLELGVPGLTDLAEVEEVLSGFGLTAGKPSPPGVVGREGQPSVPAKPVALRKNARLTAFLNSEKERLDAAASLVNRFLRADAEFSDSDKKALVHQLEQMDYVYLHFPDAVRLRELDKGLLFRVLVSLRHYTDLLARLAV